MAKNNAVNLDIGVNADGFDLAGGTTERKLTVTGADITLTGSGSNTHTYPSASDTLVGRDSTDTITNKTINTASNTITITASDVSDFDTEVSNNSSVTANTSKDTNVSTDLSEGTSTETTVNVNSSDGTNATLVSASTLRAGVLTKSKFDEIVVNNSKTGITAQQSSDITTNNAKVTYDDAAAVSSNTTHRGLTNDPHNVTATQVGLGNVSNVATDDTAYNATSWNTNSDSATKNVIRDKIETMDTAIGLNTDKNTNVSTNLSLGTGNATTEIIESSDGTNVTLIEADTTNAGILGSAKWNEIVANSLFRATPSTVITAGTNLIWDGNTLNASGGGGSPEGTAVLSTGETIGKVLTSDGDDSSSWQPAGGSPEGTAVLSTGETGATKFLGEDGDDTSSWKIPLLIDRISIGNSNIDHIGDDTYTVINFTDMILNIDDYPAGSQAEIEIVWTNNTNSTVNFVRLFDQFGAADVASSEVSQTITSGGTYQIIKIGSPFALPSGLKSYMLQVKTTTATTMNIAKAQLVITNG